MISLENQLGVQLLLACFDSYYCRTKLSYEFQITQLSRVPAPAMAQQAIDEVNTIASVEKA